MRMEFLRAVSRFPVYAAVFVAAVFFAFASHSYGMSANRTLATVDNEVITLSDYLLFVKSLGIGEKGDSVDEDILKKMIEEKVILVEAKKRGMEISDAEIDKMIEDFRKESALSQEDMEKELRKEGMDMSGYRRLLKNRLMAVKLIEAEVDSKVLITDKEVEDFYRANEKDFLSGPEKVVLKAIFLRMNQDATVTEITDLKRKALKISAQLKQGESFEALVDQYDDDHLKAQGGRWGEFERGTLIPALDERIFSMKAGETTEPLWVADGVYILKIEDRTGRTVKPVNEAAAEIRVHLRKQKREKLFNEWVKTLWEKVSIKVN